MLHSDDHRGQLCFICEMPIHGYGLLGKAPDGEGTTSYHAQCFENMFLDLYSENIELCTALLPFTLPGEYENYEGLQCSYCGNYVEVHDFDCPHVVACELLGVGET